MASIGRMRSQKRSSSSSYTSTVTTLAVIAFCVLGLWMLTSDYMVPSQVTSRKHSDSQGNLATTTAKIEDRPTNTNTKKSDSYEDNPGDLPDDDLTADDPLKQGLKKGNGIKDGDKQEKVGKLEDKDTHGLDGKESAEQHQKQNELQVSEESSFTQNEESVDHRDPENAVANGKTEVLNVDQQDQSAITEEANNSEETKNGVKNSETITNALQEEQNQTTQTFSDETKKDQTVKPESEDMTSKDDTQQGVTVPHETKTVSEEMPEGNSTATTQDNKLDTAIVLPNSGIPKESNESKASWSTQASESNKEKERHKVEDEKSEGNPYGYTWKLCNVTAGQDYIPCLDNAIALKKLHTTKHFEHRERHCPDESPTCLAPLPLLYKRPIPWPESRTKIWFHNVPHPGLAKVKGHQNWVKVTGEFLTFPGGGTQFIHGALLYIDFIEKAVPNIAWGRHTRVVLDVGCGVASFGGFLFDRNVLTMSFAPKDEHEAQVQFALERGIPAISAVMGSQRLPFPSRVFDLVHCARCRVPWHVEGGRLLLELNRMLRPGGYFVWSATPVYQKLPEDIEIWEAMSNLTKSMCWKLETIQKNQINKIAAAIFRKPTKNDCYKQREQATPPMCKRDDDPNAAWYVPLQSCMHLVPVEEYVRGSKWPAKWPNRLKTPPYWLNKTQMGIYGKPAPEDFIADYEHWKYVVNNTYLSSLGISWSNVRNVMDMRAVYGGFAAALKDLKVWVMNVVNVNAPDTLPIIFERGLFGIYHDWCESFSTYPRSYDLLHADHLFSQLKTRCNLASVLAEVDRIVRPGGNLIVRDESNVVGEVENLLKSLHWEVHLTFTKDQEGILSATKSDWRPEEYAPPF